MSSSVALVFLGVAQAIIYFVMRLFVKRAVVGEPSPLLRFIVAFIGVVAVALLLAAGYLAFVDL